MTLPSVSVLCAYPVSDIYNQNHRTAYYLAIGFVVLAPVHRWLTPAALSFIVLYSLFATLYIAALFVAPTRLGPTLDVFPLHSLLLVNTYALAVVVFCRSSLIKGRRGWMACMRMFMWQWVGFMAVNYSKSSFEKLARTITKEVQCHLEGSPSAPDNLFSIGHGLACENPCASPTGDMAMFPAHDQVRPALWGSIDAVTKQFTSMPHPQLGYPEYAIVILCGVLLSSTLWVNFFTSPQITRNSVFAIVSQGKTESRIRVSFAKFVALAWYAWSYLAILAVFLALPFVGYIQEELLKRYPVAENTCVIKQWAPWVIAVAFGLLRVAAWRRRKANGKAMRACRVRRFNAALRQLQAHGDSVPALPENRATSPSLDAALLSKDVSLPEKGEIQDVPAKKHYLEIAEVKQFNGFCDGLRELRGWWADPSGDHCQGMDSLPSADEEKALLATNED